MCAVTAVVSSLHSLQTRHCAKVPHQSDTGNMWQTQLSAGCLFLLRLLQRHTEKRLSRLQASILTNTVLTNHLRIKVHKTLQLHRRLWYADVTPRCPRRLQLYELVNWDQPTVRRLASVAGVHTCNAEAVAAMNVSLYQGQCFSPLHQK